jgi:hypothetical protein
VDLFFSFLCLCGHVEDAVTFSVRPFYNCLLFISCAIVLIKQ